MRARAAVLALIAIALALPTAARDSGECGYYINRDGARVPRPCGDAGTQAPPADATAICRDGSYSFSRHHTGTCSGHRGVQRWLH